MPTIRGHNPVLLSVFVVSTLLLSLFPGTPAASAAEQEYSEELTIFTIGSLGYWRVGLHGGNITLSGLNSIESGSSGVEGYTLFSSKHEQWSPFYEYFTKRGFGLLDYEIIPIEGMILTVSADNVESAQRFASQLSAIVEGSFASVNFGLDNSTFYSHIDFKRLVSKRLWGSIPSHYGGFAFLLDQASYFEDKMPMFIFKGERTSNGFTHSVILAGVRNGTISNKQFRLENVFRNAAKASTSSISSSSSINIVLQQNLVSSFKGFPFANDPERFRAVFQGSLSRGSLLPAIEASLVETLPAISATRTVDLGAPRKGQTVEVRVRVQHLSGEGAPPITDLSIKEDWWTPAFDKVGGTTETTMTRLAPGEKFDLIYQLKAKVDAPIAVAPSPAQNLIPYRYAIGNRTASNTVAMNPLTLRVNSLSPVISAEAAVPIANPKASTSMATTLLVKNTGNRTAFQLSAYLDDSFVKAVDSLAPGAVWTVSAELSAQPLMSTSSTARWRVTYLDEGSEKLTESNPIQLFYRMDAPAVPNVKIEKKAELKNVGETQYARVSISAVNQGSAASRFFALNDVAPSGTRVLNTTMSLDGNSLSAVVPQLGSGNKITHEYLLELAADRNYVMPPAQGITEIQGAFAKTLSNSVTLPSGIRIEQNVSLAKGFVGSATGLRIMVVNRGDISVSDVEINAGEPPGLLVSGNISKKTDILKQGDHLEASYQARLTRQGSYDAAAAGVTFYLSGQRHSVNLPATRFQVNEPVKLSLATVPSSPVEKKPFKLLLTLTNPADLPVEKVSLKLNLPAGVQLVEGSPSLEVPRLGAREVFRSEVTLVNDRALSFELNPPTLTFSFNNQQFSGQTGRLVVSVVDDVAFRYLAPIGVALGVILIAAMLGRRVAVAKSSTEVRAKVTEA